MIEDKSTEKRSKRRIFRLGKEGFIFAIVLMIGVVIILNSNDEVTVDLGENELVELANMSYILANMVSFYETDEIISGVPGIIIPEFYPSLDGLDFIDEINRFHKYFGFSKVYLNDVSIENMVFVQLSSNKYEYQLTYEVENQEYLLYFSQQGTSINAQLFFGSTVYEFKGALSEQTEEIARDLYYSKNDIFVSISASEFQAVENEKLYYVDSWIYNSEAIVTFRIHDDDSEVNIMIEDEDSSYNIAKESNNSPFVYDVEYSVSGQAGSIIIETSLDDNNNWVYDYTIEEDGETYEVKFKE